MLRFKRFIKTVSRTKIVIITNNNYSKIKLTILEITLGLPNILRCPKFSVSKS